MSSISGLGVAGLKQQVGLAVLAKSLDVVQANGQQLIQMMQQSVQPNVGGNLDIKV
ncbi:YjfB family protein [Cohnella lupini]|uniref:Putative motility protein YjfB-like n=1 Tax=Cohnella lupini TaxID=1294267 RepID=A0A3D9IVA0_9BACL|nr:YjfB family protein [Cohnella lupini]RED65036.1 putative motility protein YjfB-like [Cohnella lupini]